jgi:hypothetical protein
MAKLCRTDMKLLKKTEFYPRTYHQGPEGEQKNTCKMYVTLALDGVGGQRQVPAAIPP